MGLVPTPEHAWAKESIGSIAGIMTNYLDLEAILRIAHGTSDHISNDGSAERKMPVEIEVMKDQKRDPAARVCVQRFEIGEVVPKIGIIRDSAFQFYYPENIEALEAAGADLVFTSPLDEKEPPPMDALYIGGGFPETHARELSANASYREHLRTLAQNGFPIYAECGGLMFLGKALVMADITYPMAGIFPLTFELYQRPQGHGYTIHKVIGQNPFFEIGTEIKGHEFHYSKATQYSGDPDCLVFQVKRGAGLLEKRDGICYQNVLATYTHIHALGTPLWAKAMVDTAISYRQSN
jgi:cobyrinic acid a,c-diamide synthase